MPRDLSRLEELAKVVLPKVEEENFNLNVWHCGTAACAVGHACKHLKFNDMGLYLSRPIISSDLEPTYLDLSGWGAVQKFFGVSYKEAKHLFLREAYEKNYSKKEGKVLEELGVVSKHDDPHIDLCGVSRVDILKDAFTNLIKELF